MRCSTAEVLGSSPSYSLWRPRGAARLRLYLAGHYRDGWLGGAGRLYLWPTRAGGAVAGRVELPLVAPPEPITLRFRPQGGDQVVVNLRAGERRVISFPVCSRGPWHVSFVAEDRGFVGGRVVSAHAGEPLFVRGACTKTRTAPTADAA